MGHKLVPFVASWNVIDASINGMGFVFGLGSGSALGSDRCGWGSATDEEAARPRNMLP